MISQDGSTIYVPDYAGNAVHVVSTQTLQVTRTIPVPGGPTAAELSEDDSHLILTRWDLNDVALVDLSTDMIVDTESSQGVHPTVLIRLPGDAVLLLNYGDATTAVGGSLAAFRAMIP